MLLTIRERLILLSILPDHGDLSTVRIRRELREALSFTEEEHVKFGIVAEPHEGGGSFFKWDESADEGTEIKFGPKAKGLVLRQLEELDKGENLEEQHLPLCEKFGYGEEV